MSSHNWDIEKATFTNLKNRSRLAANERRHWKNKFTQLRNTITKIFKKNKPEGRLRMQYLNDPIDGMIEHKYKNQKYFKRGSIPQGQLPAAFDAFRFFGRRQKLLAKMLREHRATMFNKHKINYIGSRYSSYKKPVVIFKKKKQDYLLGPTTQLHSYWE